MCEYHMQKLRLAVPPNLVSPLNPNSNPTSLTGTCVICWPKLHTHQLDPANIPAITSTPIMLLALYYTALWPCTSIPISTNLPLNTKLATKLANGQPVLISPQSYLTYRRANLSNASTQCCHHYHNTNVATLYKYCCRNLLAYLINSVAQTGKYYPGFVIIQ